MNLHIVLVEPEIPSNTGNISRTCSIIDATLHLVHPLGFDISEKAVRRAGLDYWDELKLFEYQSFSEVKEKYPEKEIWVELGLQTIHSSTSVYAFFTIIFYHIYVHFATQL